MTTKFTPGPYGIEDRAVQGIDIVAVVPKWSISPVRIARVMPFANAKDTANLFAAAPDMYAALKALHNDPNCNCGSDDSGKSDCPFEMASLALMKAEGRNV